MLRLVISETVDIPRENQFEVLTKHDGPMDVSSVRATMRAIETKATVIAEGRRVRDGLATSELLVYPYTGINKLTQKIVGESNYAAITEMVDRVESAAGAVCSGSAALGDEGDDELPVIAKHYARVMHAMSDYASAWASMIDQVLEGSDEVTITRRQALAIVDHQIEEGYDDEC